MNEFLIDKQQVRRAFNRASAGYDAAAVLQREVCARMLERLEYIKLQPERILDAGSGTGWGTRRLTQRYPAAQMIALDIASGMLQTARGRSGWWQKLFGGTKQILVCGDIETLPLATNSVEMVWSNLAVQWCNDLPATFVELHRVLKSGRAVDVQHLRPGYAEGIKTGIQWRGPTQPSQPFRGYARHRRHAGTQRLCRAGDGYGIFDADI